MTEPKLLNLDPGLALIPASTCLVNNVADRLAQLSPEILSQTTVVLPTMRLKVQLQAALYERLKRSFVPPNIQTLSHLIRNFSSISGRLEKPPLASDLDIELLMGKLLNSPGGGGGGLPMWAKRLRPVHAHELLLLFKEAEDLQVRDKLLQALATFVETSDRHGEEALADIKERVESIAAFFSVIDDELKGLGLTYSRAWDNQVAQNALRVAGEVTEQHGFIVVAGLTSAAPAQLEILRVLLSRQRVAIILPEPAETPAGGGKGTDQSPLHSIINSLTPNRLSAVPDRISLIAKPGRGGIVSCQSIDQEVDAALALALTHIKSGTPAHRIAIAITNEQAYRGVVVGAMTRLNLQGNLALPIQLRQTSVGAWIELFLACVASSSEPQEFLPLLFHPLTIQGANSPTSLAEMQKTVCDIPILNSLRALAANTAAQWLADRIESLTQDGKASKSMQSWTETLSRAIPMRTDLTLAEEIGDFEFLAQKAVQEFFATSLASPLSTHLFMTLGEFVTYVMSNLLSQELHRIGEPLQGLQILSFAETRFLPLHVVIVTGCHEGQLPERLPQDELLDHHLKPHFGLRPSAYVENLQDMNFALLTSRVPIVYLCHSAGAIGSSTTSGKIRSRYIDLLHVQNFPEFAADKILEVLSSDERVPTPSAQTPDSQALEGQNSHVPFILERGGATSASRLRDLISCPYRWMVGASRLRTVQLPTTDTPAQLEGTLLHAVLEIFWTGRCASLPHCQAVNMPWTAGHEQLSDEAWHTVATTRLREATHIVFGNHTQHIPLFVQLNTRSWPNLAQHLVGLRRKVPDLVSSSLNEWRLDFEWSWNDGDRLPALQIRGAIDTVLMASPTADQGIALIMDYKRTIAPQNRDIRLGLDPQLFLYTEATRQAARSDQSWHGMAGYWEIYKGKWHARLDCDSPSEFSYLRGRTTPTLTDARTGLNRTLSMRHTTVTEQQRYYADPSHCGLCDHAGLCRRDDPSQQDRIKEQARLKQMLDDDKAGAAP